MKTTPAEEEGPHKYYILKTAVGDSIMRVRYRDMVQFYTEFAELIIGEGDTLKEALQDWERKRQKANPG